MQHEPSEAGARGGGAAAAVALNGAALLAAFLTCVILASRARLPA